LNRWGFNIRRDEAVAAHDLVPEPEGEEDRHQRDRDEGTHIEKSLPGSHSYSMRFIEAKYTKQKT
jgi:hypothetical protein